MELMNNIPPVDILYLFATFAGMFLHGVVSWGRGETHCVSAYFTSEFPRATSYAMAVNLVGVAMAIQQGILAHATPETAIVTGLLQGFTADRLMNRGKRVIWTEEQRMEHRKKKGATSADPPDGTGHPGPAS